MFEGSRPQNKRTNYTEEGNAVRAYRWKTFEPDGSDLIGDKSVKLESVSEWQRIYRKGWPPCIARDSVKHIPDRHITATKSSAPTMATGESETKVGVEVPPLKLRAIIAVGILYCSPPGTVMIRA